MNGGFVWSDVLYYTGSSNKSGSPLSFSQAAAAEPKPWSTIDPRRNAKTQRDGQKNRGTQRYREIMGKNTTHTHTHAHTSTLHMIPWLYWTAQGIMRGRWSKILIRSLFALLIITSMCWGWDVGFVYSSEGEKTTTLLIFYKICRNKLSFKQIGLEMDSAIANRRIISSTDIFTIVL